MTLTDLRSVGISEFKLKKKVEHIQERGLRKVRVRASIERNLLNRLVRSF